MKKTLNGQLTIDSQAQHLVACQIGLEIDLKAELFERRKQVRRIDIRTSSFLFAGFLKEVTIVDHDKMTTTRMTHIVHMFLISRIIVGLRFNRLRSNRMYCHTA